MFVGVVVQNILSPRNFFFIFLILLVLCTSKNKSLAEVITLPKSQADSIDCVIKSYLRFNPAMGLSVAIAHKGKPIYMKGYGWANRNNGLTVATENTIYRTASVAKGITGVLALVLKEKNLINLKTKAKNTAYLPNLPIHHLNYNLEDLLSNRSKIRHYCCSDCDQKDANGNEVCTGSDPVKKAGKMKSAWEATKLFTADPLVNKNDALSDKKYHYSTHAYTVFAAAVEAKINKNFCSILEKHISRPHGLNTLRCEFRNIPNSRRAALYSSSGNGFVSKTPDDLSWKYGGGGMEISARDLMRFGVKLNGLKILRKKWQLDRLLTRPDNSADYGLGWDVNQRHDAYSYYSKSGGQRGARAYLRIYRDEDLVVALMANTRGDSMSQMTDEIARIILSSEPLRPELRFNNLHTTNTCPKNIEARLTVDYRTPAFVQCHVPTVSVRFNHNGKQSQVYTKKTKRKNVGIFGQYQATVKKELLVW